MNGDFFKGKDLYNQICEKCHGEDDREQNFGGDINQKYIGRKAIDDPEAFFEIINFGDGEREMPGFYNDLSLKQLINILTYTQILPTE